MLTFTLFFYFLFFHANGQPKLSTETTVIYPMQPLFHGAHT
jgi:hypothetical protein